MKVKELIEKLGEFDGETDVIIAVFLKDHAKILNIESVSSNGNCPQINVDF